MDKLKNTSAQSFKFCEGCEIYPCELIPEFLQYRSRHGITYQTTGRMKVLPDDDESVCHLEITMPYDHTDGSYEERVSYDVEEAGDRCSMRYINGFEGEKKECGRRRVSEGLGDAYKIEMNHEWKIRKDLEGIWNHTKPVFISAQTGQGKNYFIENILLKYVRSLNHNNVTVQKVLILSNRRVLKRQIQERLREKNGDSIEAAEAYFGVDADIMTYQELLQREDYIKNRQSNERSKYIFVVCDEAHFFSSDAMFNPHTKKILEKIVLLFKKAVRIYMSATPYSCLKYIHEEERKLPKHNLMMFYHFKRDYSYLDTKVFSDFEELNKVIVDSVIHKKEKWLIFIDNIKECTALQSKLCEPKTGGSPSMNGKVATIDATSKADDLYTSIVLEEKLSKDIYVLISTSVLDNGINLRGIKNIVVSDLSKEKVLQMVGRARVDSIGERKTLYLKRFKKEYVNARISALEKREDGYHKFNLAYCSGPAEIAN